MHAQVEEHVGNGHLDQRREIHEDTENDADEIAQYRVAAGQGLNPFRLDERPDSADDEHAHDQQWEDLFDEAPGLPQPLLNFILIKVGACHVPQQDHRRQHGKRLASEMDVQAAGVRYHLHCRHVQCEGNQPQRRPRPGVVAFIDLIQAEPGADANENQQADQNGPLRGDTLFAPAGID